MIPLLADLETEWRGGQNQFFLLLKGLYERGHAAELLATRGSALAARCAEAGICVHRVSHGASRLFTAWKIRKLLATGRFDLIHVNESHALTAAWMARAHRRVPLLISRRVGYPLGQSWFSKRRFASAAAILANSQWVADQAAASGAPKGKLKVIYEGVKIPELPAPNLRRNARSRWTLPSDAPLLGCVGVLSPDKGHEFVIRALAQVRREFPAARLLLAGDGPARSHLENVAKECGVREAVLFAGFVKEIEQVYQALDIFVFPSLFEGLGTSLLAAMSYAIPSITFFGCALGEIVENGISGIQVQPENSAEIADAAARLLREPAFAAQIGQAGRRRIEAIFSSDRMVDETLRAYREILDAKSPS